MDIQPEALDYERGTERQERGAAHLELPERAKANIKFSASARLKRETNYIPTLDGWRGIAILLVVLDHATDGIGTGLSREVLRVGATGVSLFFALSGFLITTRLLEEMERAGTVSLKQFYIRRVFRLIPASLTYLLVLAVLTRLGILAVTWKQWLSSLLFFRNYIPVGFLTGGWFTAHFWSLAVEEHFYIFWPVLLVRTKARPIVPAMIAISVAAWRYVDLHYHIVNSPLWFPGRTDVRLDGLLWGCFLAILFRRTQIEAWVKRYYADWMWIACLGGYLISNVVTAKHNYSPYEPLLIALIVVWPVLHAGSLLGRLLETRVLKWIGRLSYSIYVWQQLWLVFPEAAKPLGAFQRMPLNLVCVLVCSVLSYYLIEKTMIQFGHRLTPSPTLAIAP
jgi:peptidoglycan/LPS O-acetylase OafA/YrhL